MPLVWTSELRALLLLLFGWRVNYQLIQKQCMEHPSSATLKSAFSAIGKQDKEEIFRNLHASASDLGILVDSERLYLNRDCTDISLPLTSIHCILIANGCFYIQFSFDKNGILVLELETGRRDVIVLRQRQQWFVKVYYELLYRMGLAKRGFRYFCIRLRRRWQ